MRHVRFVHDSLATLTWSLNKHDFSYRDEGNIVLGEYVIHFPLSHR